MAFQRTLPIFDEARLDQVVNVASVPQRSPFRYPGGKTWLIPRIRVWLASLTRRPRTLVEPFAGGAIVGLTVAAERMADHVVLVELDADVAAVWQTLIYGDAHTLADRILDFEPSVEKVEALLSQPPRNTEERAFQTILRNRVNHGGILAPGPGRIKHGENGKGVWSRWYPRTLHKRILDIAKMRERITFVQGDGIEMLRQWRDDSTAAFFIDPPYTAAGKFAGRRLYTHYELNHEELFRLVSQLAGDALMTYDNAEEIKSLAQRHSLDVCAVAMSNTHHARMLELLIGRNLAWARTGPAIEEDVDPQSVV